MTERVFYESCNDDVWLLTRDPVEDARRGAQADSALAAGHCTEIGKFLRNGASGPEQQALLHLIGALLDG